MRRQVATASAILALALGVVATTAAGASTSETRTSHGGHIVRFNEGATHSPELERLLAGHPVAPSAAARARPAALASSASTVEGIDVASLQHPDAAAINWSRVAQAQYKFAFIKVSEGSYYANPYYRSDTSGAEDAGLFVAPYAFAIPNYSGGALQADYAL